jgi:hypothetical protein
MGSNYSNTPNAGELREGKEQWDTRILYGTVVIVLALVQSGGFTIPEVTFPSRRSVDR